MAYPKSAFFNVQQEVTESTLTRPWYGYRDGRMFRCHLCGYKFKVGDKFRAVFTNDMPGAAGNPLVCEDCDTDTGTVREAWAAMHTEMRKQKWWWFQRDTYD